MATFALIIAVLAVLGMAVAFLPFLGWLNWLNIPFALLGCVIAAIAALGGEKSRQKAVTALVISSIAVAMGLVRLVLGGGLF
jgi:hypothetical protein